LDSQHDFSLTLGNRQYYVHRDKNIVHRHCLYGYIVDIPRNIFRTSWFGRKKNTCCRREPTVETFGDFRDKRKETILYNTSVYCIVKLKRLRHDKHKKTVPFSLFYGFAYIYVYNRDSIVCCLSTRTHIDSWRSQNQHHWLSTIYNICTYDCA